MLESVVKGCKYGSEWWHTTFNNHKPHVLPCGWFQSVDTIRQAGMKRKLIAGFRTEIKPASNCVETGSIG